MDKEYVINLLSEKKEILNSRFIDKFFQLEVYLPAIRNNTLRTIFKNLLIKKTGNFSEYFKINLEVALGSRYNLFDDYIKNIRDVKRTVNQIVYEYPFLKDSIDLKDFFNFTYFKLKFPKFLKVLNDDRGDILKKPINSNYLELREKQNKNKTNSTVDNLSWRYRSGEYDYKALQKYKLYDSLDSNNNPNNFNSFLSSTDKKLVLKTFSFLFGRDNSIKTSKSIKNVANFRMLMEQRIFETHVTDTEFDDILQLNYAELKQRVKSFYEKNKLVQLLDRIDFTAPKNLEEFQAIIEILVYIYDKRFEYNQFDSVLFKKLAVQVDNFLKIINENEDKEDFIQTLKVGIFENDEVSYETKLFLLTELWIERQYNSLWKIDKEYINTISIKYYKQYLLKHTKNLWELDNYTFYHIGNNLRRLESLKDEINQLTINFWKHNNVELLCVQETKIDTWILDGFVISDNTIEIFGSYSKFIDFIKNHSDANKPEIKEFINLYELLQRVNFSKIILYTFTASKMMINKIAQRKKQSKDRSQNEKLKQLFFTTNKPNLFEKVKNNTFTFSEAYHGNIELFSFKKEFVLLLSFNKGYLKNEIEQFAQEALNKFSLLEKKEKIPLNLENLWRGKNLITKPSKYYIKLISNQPKKKLN